MNASRIQALARILFIAMLIIAASFAAESGSSHYMPGTLGDFTAGMVGPKGFYLRSDLLYYRGDIGSVTLGNRIFSSANQRVWADMIKTIYVTDAKILGGRLVAAATFPIVFNAKVSGTLVSSVQGQASGSRSGLGDVTLTSFLNWSKGTAHFSGGMNVYVPVSGYDPNDTINRGRNYWSTVPTFSYTWLDPKRGHEISATTGFMFNSTNNATQYKSGNEWYMDFMVAQHFSPKFAIGMEGYTVQQFTDDSGALLDRANVVLPALGLEPLGGFRGRSFGIGPAVVFTPKIGDTNISVIANGCLTSYTATASIALTPCCRLHSSSSRILATRIRKDAIDKSIPSAVI